MPLQFTVLASGSAGNASLLECGSFGVLIDAGLGPRTLAKRLHAAGASWNNVHAVLLTHIHSDHWTDSTFRAMLRRQIRCYCHAEHHASLLTYGDGFAALLDAGLVYNYDDGEELMLAPDLHCRPFAVRHDSGATFGFRFEGAKDLFAASSALAYAADLGSWTQRLAEHLADVDLLALEFNHDVDMECASGRPWHLIARVLGEDGHLSNEQAAELLQEVLSRSTPGRLRHVVQLHLSRECNRPILAAQTAQSMLNGMAQAPRVYTASQDEPTPTIALGAGAGRRAVRRARRIRLDQSERNGPKDIQACFSWMQV